jgi:hypothetical protein
LAQDKTLRSNLSLVLTLFTSHSALYVYCGGTVAGISSR